MSTVCHIIKCNCCGTLINLLEEDVSIFDQEHDEHYCLRCESEEDGVS